MRSGWRTARRLPWIRPSDTRDCGAAAFASLAAFYDHHISLEQARELVATDRDGTTLSGLRDGGRRLGFDAHAAKAVYEALPHLTLPAIAHLSEREGHYVVIIRWAPGGVTVLDPNRGVRRLSRDSFESAWSGYVVEYRPTASVRPRKADFRPGPAIVALLHQHRLAMILALVCALTTASLGWIYSFYLQTLIDRIAPSRDHHLLFTLGSGLVLISLVQSALYVGRPWLVARVGRAVFESYSARYLDHLLMLPVRVFETRTVPSLAMRLNQAEHIQQALTEGLINVAADSVMLGVTLGLIVFYDPTVALLVVGGTPVLLLGMLLFNRKIVDAQMQAMVQADDFMGYLTHIFDGIRTIKIFGAERTYQRLLQGRLRDVAAARYASRVALFFPSVWSMLSTSLVAVAVLWYGGEQVVAKAMPVGHLIVLFGIVMFYLTPIQRLPAVLLSLRSALLGMQRIEEILALPREAPRTDAPRRAHQVTGKIEFDHVTFGYKARNPVLRDINLIIHPGETVAIVGESGSGKSSLASLIAGFYVPTQGEVRIDGVSTRSISPEDLRRSISAVFQGPQIFHQSIFDNITMLQGQAELSSVEAAAERANAASFIKDLHKGYLTQISPGAGNISAGQTQRIALARALLKDAPILILDESTSNVDGATEQAILQALERGRGRQTTIIIAHRLSTILGADRIIVMHQGQVVEEGTHDSLIRNHGRYADLFRLQLAG